MVEGEASPEEAAAAGVAAAGKLWYNRIMLDINFVRENLKLVETSSKEKGYKIDFKKLLKLDDSRRELLQQVEDLRKQKNDVAASMKGGKPSPELIAKGKSIKEKLASLEKSLSEQESALKTALKSVPNIIFDDVPLGGEECSVEVKAWGDHRSHDAAVDHLDVLAVLRRHRFGGLGIGLPAGFSAGLG